MEESTLDKVMLTIPAVERWRKILVKLAAHEAAKALGIKCADVPIDVRHEQLLAAWMSDHSTFDEGAEVMPDGALRIFAIIPPNGEVSQIVPRGEWAWMLNPTKRGVLKNED